MLALAFSRELRAELEASGRYQAVMTRDGDHKVGLHRRVEIAREAEADLFLSIHLDRLENRQVSGASVYTLSDEASDVETAELAAREKQGGHRCRRRSLRGLRRRGREGADFNGPAEHDELLGGAGGDAAGRSSAAWAPLISRPHRFGNFRVLKAPDIPSVLVELGFLSNDQDAERLQSESHRLALWRGAIVKALDTYFREPC